MSEPLGLSKAWLEKYADSMEKHIDNLEAKIDNLEEAQSQARDRLNAACKLYCNWFDHGKPEYMDGAGCAYELVTACRQAMKALGY